MSFLQVDSMLSKGGQHLETLTRMHTTTANGMLAFGVTANAITRQDMNLRDDATICRRNSVSMGARCT